ncbi:MAG: hypothetical protein ABL984_11170 [Pyrinomonadaceae bacterium]
MQLSSAFFKTIKFLAIALAALMLAGIATVMFLARNTNEDITGVVAPALLITILSGATAFAASILQKRAKGRLI